MGKQTKDASNKQKAEMIKTCVTLADGVMNTQRVNKWRRKKKQTIESKLKKQKKKT